MSVTDDGREELARRLNRIFIAPADQPEANVPHETLLEFAGDLLAADYTDHRWGSRPGDGGPAYRFVPRGDA